MTVSRESRKIVAAVVGLGQSLGLRTVAEGIETQEQAEMMLWLGSELGQGWFYGRPVSGENLASVIATPRFKLATHDSSPWKRLSESNREGPVSQRLAQLQAVFDGALVGLAFVDHDFRYVNLNQKLARMNGGVIEDYLGSTVAETAPELFPIVEPFISRALAGEAIAEMEAQLPGSRETCLISYQPARDEAGEVVGVAIAMMDITDRREAQDALRESKEHYRRMVELNPQVIWATDPEGRDLDVSPKWDGTTGFMKPQALSDGWLGTVHPDDLSQTIQTLAACRRTGAPINVEYRVADGAGNWRQMRSRGSPRFDDMGKVVCWYGSVESVEDIAYKQTATEEVPPRVSTAFGGKAKAFQLRTHKSALDNLLQTRESPDKDLGRSLTLNMDLDEDRIRIQALHDLELLDTPPEEEFDELVQLASAICDAPISLVSLVESDRQWFKASVGLEAKETPINVSFCAHAIKQEGLFIVEDATKDERFQENALVLENPKIRFYAGVPLYVGEGTAVGTLCVIDTVPRTLTSGQAKALATLSAQVQSRMELRVERRNLWRALEENREHGATLEADNRILTQTNSQLEQLATTDALTGLLNRRAFEETMGAELLRATAEEDHVSLLIMDIDDFKKRNDLFGHAAGDEALRYLGRVLKGSLRSNDFAARIGGEEFAIILPNTEPHVAELIANRLQKSLVEETTIVPPITLSVGVSCSSVAVSSLTALFEQADQAMYEAKRSGKNKVVTSRSCRDNLSAA